MKIFRGLNEATLPLPPSLHWTVMLLASVLSIIFTELHLVLPGGMVNIFLMIWIIIQCRFIKKIDPTSKAIWLCLLAIASGYAWGEISSANPLQPKIIRSFESIVSSGLLTWAAFSVRSSMLRYYNVVEPINLRLSKGMTLFFNFLYFQYHFSRIVKWKKTGVLTPQVQPEVAESAPDDNTERLPRS